MSNIRFNYKCKDFRTTVFVNYHLFSIYRHFTQCSYDDLIHKLILLLNDYDSFLNDSRSSFCNERLTDEILKFAPPPSL